MRIRGEVFAQLGDPTTPDTSSQAVAIIGIGLSNKIEGDPGNDYEDPYNHSFSNDWMWWQTIYLGTTDSAGAFQPGTSSARFVLDVRSKRRVDPSDELVMVVVNAAPVVAPGTLGALCVARVLIQET